MRVTSPLTDRQLAVLRWVADGCPPHVMTGHGHKRTARALADRKLVEISRRGGDWRATLGPAGRYYLDNGHHPDLRPLRESGSEKPPRTPERPTVPAPAQDDTVRTCEPRNSVRRRPEPVRATAAEGRSRRLREARLLLERLADEHYVRISDATDAMVSDWRKIVEVARRQNLVPEDKQVTTTRMFDGSFEIRLAAGRHPNSRRAQPPADLPAVPVPERLDRPHAVVARIRDDPGRLVMPRQPNLRRRALRLLQALVSEARRRGYEVDDCPVPSQHHRNYYWGGRGKDDPLYIRHEAQLYIVIDGFSYTVDLRRENPVSADLAKVPLLKLELPGRRVSRSTWADRKTRSLEDALSAVLHELEQRAVADRRRAIEAEQARADRKVRWEVAMDAARILAVEVRYAEVLRSQIERWEESARIRRYALALAQRIEAPGAGDLGRDAVRSARDWLEWVTAYADREDPLGSLPRMPARPMIRDCDLGPFLEGWSVYGPEHGRG